MAGNIHRRARPGYSPWALIAMLALLLALGTAGIAIAGTPVDGPPEMSNANNPAAMSHLGGAGYWDPGFADLIDGEVDAIAISGTELYAGGWFASAGGVSARRIARWDGSTWYPLGTGIFGYQFYVYVSAIAITGTDVFVGGVFSGAEGVPAHCIIRWDGSMWHSLGYGTNAPVRALAVGSDGVYVGGSFTDAGGVSANHIARWDGSTWYPLGSGTNGIVNSIAISGTELYASGHFTAAGGVSANNIARWNGSTWSPLGSGLTDNSYARGYSVAISGTELYAGGVFTAAGGVSTNNIARWNGSTWSPLGIGISGDQSMRVSAIAVNGGDLYVGGRFTTAGGVSVNNIARWDGASWSPLDSGLNGPAYAIEPRGNDLIVGGNFTTAGGVESGQFGIWHIGITPTPSPIIPTATFTATSTFTTTATNTPGNTPTNPTTGTPINTPTNTNTATNSPTDTPGNTPTNTLTPGPTTCTLEFEDVPNGSTFYPFVRCLACQGILSGYPCGDPGEPCIPPGNKPYFRPNSNITRAQIAKIVSNAAGFIEPHANQSFQDVPANHTFYLFVERLASRNVIGGYPCGGVSEPCIRPENRPYYRPGSNTSRGQLSKIVCRAYGCAGQPTGQTFEDVTQSSTFYADIEHLYALGAIDGYACGNPEPCIPPGNRPYFRPGNNVTRGQTTKIVANTFFPDCSPPAWK